MKKILGVDTGVFLLGIVSFLTDISSEMIFSVFSIFFTAILGASSALLGLIEGLADFSASSLDYIAGYLSDLSGKRKRYAIIGYGFSTLAKIILVMASTVSQASLFRVVERLGKSFRGPPRDAWISQLSSRSKRGFSFGVHKALDKSGAILGPLLAYFLLKHWGESEATFHSMFMIALVPAALAVLFLFFLKDKQEKPVKKESIFKGYDLMTKKYRHYLKTAALFSLAYFSFSFLLLKAYNVGFSIEDVILLYALFNITFVITAPVVGKLGDRLGREKIVMLGFATYLLMCLGFMITKSKAGIIALFLLFGVFYAIDESQSKAYISDLEPRRKGQAIGLYNFVTGVFYLPAGILAGALWSIDPAWAFAFGSLVSASALIFFVRR